MLRQSGTYSLVVLATRAAAFLALPIYTRYLLPADYGSLELVDLVCSFMATVLGLRLGDALLYYHASASSQKLRDRVVSTVLLGTIVLGGLVMVGGWVSAPAISELIFRSHSQARYFRLALPTFGLSLPLEVALCYLRALGRARTYVAVSAFRLFIGLALSVTLLVSFGLGLSAILWANLVSTCAAACWVAAYCLIGSGIHFERSVLLNLIRYSAPLSVSAVSLFVIHYGDRFFLQRYVSLSDIGLYSLAYKVGMLVSYVQMPFGMYWNARMFTIIQRHDGELVFARTCTYVILVLTYVALCLAVLCRPLVSIVAAPGFQACSQFIPALLAAYVIRSIGDQFRNVFFLAKRTGADAWVTGLSSIVCLSCYVAFIPRWKVWGAIVSTVITFAVAAGLALALSQRIRAIPFEKLRLLQITGIAGALFIIFSGLSSGEFASDLVLGCAVITAYPFVLALCGFFNGEELAMLIALSRRIRGRVLTTAA